MPKPCFHSNAVGRMERRLSLSRCRRHQQRIALPMTNNPAAQVKRQATSKVERKRLVLPGALR